MEGADRTVKFSPGVTEPVTCAEILEYVFKALMDKGYSPRDQLVGYLISGDPTYITSHKNARTIICRVDRDEIIRELVKNYLLKLKIGGDRE